MGSRRPANGLCSQWAVPPAFGRRMTALATGHPHGSLLEFEPRAPFRRVLTTWALRRRPHNAIDRWDKLRRRFVIDTRLDHESVQQLVARWQPYAGVVYFHLLLDSLSQADLVTQHEVRQHTGGAS